MIEKAVRGAVVVVFGGIVGLLTWGLVLALGSDTVQLGGDRAAPERVNPVPTPSETAVLEPRSSSVDPSLDVDSRAADTASGESQEAPSPDQAPDVLAATVTAIPRAALLDSPGPSGEPTLVEVLDLLIADAGEWNPGVEASIAVSVDGEIHVSGSEAQVNSASAAKAMWLVATSVIAGPEAVVDEAEAMIGLSDNDATARVIGTVGVDPINGFTRAMGLAETHLAGWPFVGNWRSRTYAAGDRVNVTTTSDLVTFYDAIAEGTVLGDDRAQITEFLQLAPDRKTDNGGPEASVYGAVLTDQLPLAVAEATAHKSGWLPPGCCTSSSVLLIAAGSVPIPPVGLGPGAAGSGERYSIAIWMKEGTNFARSVDFMSYASCVVFEAVTGIGRGCPEPTRTGADR